jgi:hypothetical protein
MSDKTMNSGFMASGSVADSSPATTGFPWLQGLDNPQCQRIKVSKRNWIRAAILSMGATKCLVL